MATEQPLVPPGSSIYILVWELQNFDNPMTRTSITGVFNTLEAAKAAGIKIQLCTGTYGPDKWVVRVDINGIEHWYRFLTAVEPKRELALRAYEWIVRG